MVIIMKNIYIKTPSNQFGPLSVADFKRLIKLGLFTLQDYVWNYHQNTWLKIEDFAELQPYLNYPVMEKKAGKVVGIASGKGGVGKTALTASMAMELANMGRKVVVVDADFGGPDLHEWMGISRPPITLNALFKNRNIGLNDLLVDTFHENIKIICGEVGSIEASNPKYFQRLKFIRQLRELDADYILIDQSPGVSYATVDIYLSCDEGIIVTLPEPTSFMDAFNFIRSSLLRKLKKSLAFSDCAIEQLNEFENWDWRKYDQSMREILVKIERNDPRAGTIFKGIIHQFKPKIVANMVFKSEEAQEGRYFQETLTKLLMIKAEYLGFIEYKKDFRENIKEARPFILSMPEVDVSGVAKTSAEQLRTWFKSKAQIFSRFKTRQFENHISTDVMSDHVPESFYSNKKTAKKYTMKLPADRVSNIQLSF